MKPKYILHSAFCILTLLCGCAGFQVTPADLDDARDIAEVGTLAALQENPKHLKAIEEVRAALRIVELLPQDKATLKDLEAAFAPLIRSGNGKFQLYYAAGKPIIRRLLANGESREVDVSRFKSIPQVAKALKEGIDLALNKPPATL